MHFILSWFNAWWCPKKIDVAENNFFHFIVHTKTHRVYYTLDRHSDFFGPASHETFKIGLTFHTFLQNNKKKKFLRKKILVFFTYTESIISHLCVFAIICTSNM